MPLYEYRCPACAERFELLQRVGASAESVECPRCGNGAVERQLSTFAAATGGRKSDSGADSAGCGLPQCCAASGFTCAN